jgi:hypothetical protein
LVKRYLPGVLMFRYLAVILAASTATVAQNPSQSNLASPSTIPVTFTNAVSANRAKPGDPVEAKTIQQVQLPGGGLIPSGSRVVGHVVSANGFAYDKTPYARQRPSALSIRFDSVQVKGETIPLNVTVRAIASPIATWDAQSPKATDMDSLGTRTQVGGDLLVPSQAEVRNMDDDVVAYNKKGGVYAHLIARDGCDGSDVEVSVAIFSASACGAYGFGNVSLTERGSSATPSTLTLVSAHGSPELWKHTTALLEVLPTQTASVER